MQLYESTDNIHLWFNNVVSKSDYIASSARLIFDNNFKRTWKKAGIAEFQVQARNLPGGAEKNN